MSSTKILCIGDIHVKVNNIKESNELINSIYRVIETNHIDLIVVMGDVLDRHETIHVAPLTLATNFLIKLSTLKRTFVLIGNHDRPNNSDFLSEYHPFIGLHGRNNLTIVDKVNYFNFNNNKFLFVPYVYPGRFLEAISTFNRENSDFKDLQEIKCIFAHQEFYGTSMGVVISTVGDKWPVSNPYVISGHIHDYCRPQKNIVYVGTPHQNAFGESEDKTISLFTFLSGSDSDDAVLTYPEEQRIDLKLKKRLVCRVACKDVVKWIPPEGYLLKLVIEGTSSEIKAIMKLDYIKKLSKSGIKIVYNTLDEIKTGINKQIKKEELKLPYGNRLRNSIQNDEGKLYWFNRLFQSK